jgi:uracil-DNA glycosylase family 4
MTKIFINYRRLDSEGYAGRLYDHLGKYFEPFNIFMDVENIEPGADFVAALDEAVAACDVILVIIGPHWLGLKNDLGERRLDEWDDYVRIEIERGISHNKLVIPVLVGGSRMPAPKQLPETIEMLTRRNAFVLSHRHFGRDVQEFSKFIKEAVPSHPTFKPRAKREALHDKEQRLKAVRMDLIKASDSPLYAYRSENRYFPVFGDGFADANIMVIGQAPGEKEAKEGVVFTGPSGEVLDELLASIELKREDIFITNIVLDRTPKNRDPLPEELEFYGNYLDRMIEIIQPRVIVPLGAYAMTYILKKLDLPEKTGKISQLHGKLIQTETSYGDLHILPMYHPANTLYNPSQKPVLREDFAKLRMFI